MEVGFRTDKGKMRSNNEDACYVMPFLKVFIVADGVGGNNSGEIASRTAVDSIVQYIRKHPMDDVKNLRSVKQYFNRCLKAANDSVLENSRKFDQNKGMATTVVISYFVEDRVYILNIGDSRAYIFRNGELKQLTEDHTYVNSLVKAGVITTEEAENHVKRNMITRAVGAGNTVEADYFVQHVRPGDIILLCTDGLYGEVDAGEIAGYLGQGRTMIDTCYELLKQANRNGGSDNITMICVKVTEDDINE